MYLRAINLRGFKSFPEPVEIRLEPGVAVVVGPNGSGKSNVADAIVWAAGSMAPSELRAEKPDDVLFAGSNGRKPADSCEVELLFDNGEGDDLAHARTVVMRLPPHRPPLFGASCRPSADDRRPRVQLASRACI